MWKTLNTSNKKALNKDEIRDLTVDLLFTDEELAEKKGKVTWIWKYRLQNELINRYEDNWFKFQKVVDAMSFLLEQREDLPLLKDTIEMVNDFYKWEVSNMNTQNIVNVQNIDNSNNWVWGKDISKILDTLNKNALEKKKKEKIITITPNWA